jgi:hypothetical protein
MSSKDSLQKAMDQQRNEVNLNSNIVNFLVLLSVLVVASIATSTGSIVLSEKALDEEIPVKTQNGDDTGVRVRRINDEYNLSVNYAGNGRAGQGNTATGTDSANLAGITNQVNGDSSGNIAGEDNVVISHNSVNIGGTTNRIEILITLLILAEQLTELRLVNGQEMLPVSPTQSAVVSRRILPGIITMSLGVPRLILPGLITESAGSMQRILPVSPIG